MTVNPHPYSVWLYYHSKADAVAEKSQSIFGRVLSDEEYVKLLDARIGEVVRISVSRYEQSPGFFIPMIFFKLCRTIQVGTWSGTVKVECGLSNDGSGPQLTLQDFQIPEEAHGKGLGTRMFAAQVEAARAFGFDQIIATAVGGKVEHKQISNHPLVQQLLDDGVEVQVKQDNRNGYYTWPRLGFDKELTPKEQSRLHPQFSHFAHLSDLMQHPKGRAWWRDNGFALEVTFDTSPQSRSMEMLNAALDRLAQRGGQWEIVPNDIDESLLIERGEKLRTRRGWRERKWVYREN